MPIWGGFFRRKIPPRSPLGPSSACRCAKLRYDSAMKRLIKRILGAPARAPAAPFCAPLQPAGPFAVVADIHGRADLLTKLMAMLDDLPPAAPVVFVGDYLDRGEESRAVLEYLSHPDTGQMREFICLMGNHEEMCLSFLDNPEASGRAWLRYGGLQTLASFGVSGAGDLRRARDALALAMGDRLITWLRNRPLTWHSGNITVTHAAADPGRAIEAQERASLLWGHPDFTRIARQDGRWIVHGHTIVDAPLCDAGRIALDTGAYATGRLTAAVFEGTEVTFRQTTM